MHQFPGAFSPGVTTPDSNSKYTLNTQSFYARDTIEFTRFLQIIAAGRFDRFDETALDMNTNTTRNRIDNFVSPQAAAILKPTENLSLYYAYMVSYLPASGDQFSALTDGTVILAPQKFVNNEVGIKWNALPHLLFSAAGYELNRYNVPLPDPNRPGFFILSGANRIRGFETELKGYLTDNWQSWLGYAYTDARISGATSATILPGNRIQLVPLNQFSWWNKYQFTPVWSASVGVIYFSDSFASSDDTVYLPGFVRVDAGVYAQITANWKAQLNVENLFNKGYWASADGNNNLSPGQGRTYRVKATLLTRQRRLARDTCRCAGIRANVRPHILNDADAGNVRARARGSSVHTPSGQPKRGRHRRSRCARELAAEIVPAMLPMRRGHHLAPAPDTRGLVRHRGTEACRLPGQLRLARLFQKDADASRVRDRRAAERHAVIGQQHRELAAERPRQRGSLVFRGDQRHLVGVARHVDGDRRRPRPNGCSGSSDAENAQA